MNKKTICVLLIICAFITGISAGFMAGWMAAHLAGHVSIGNSDTSDESASEKPIYRATSQIYYSDQIQYNPKPVHEIREDLAVHLRDETLRTRLDEKYPDAEYELTVETEDNTRIYKVTATSESPENLHDIANMAVSYLCEIDSACRILFEAAPVSDGTT